MACCINDCTGFTTFVTAWLQTSRSDTTWDVRSLPERPAGLKIPPCPLSDSWRCCTTGSISCVMHRDRSALRQEALQWLCGAMPLSAETLYSLVKHWGPEVLECVQASSSMDQLRVISNMRVVPTKGERRLAKMHAAPRAAAVSVLLAVMISLQDHDQRLVECVSYQSDEKFVERVDVAIARSAVKWLSKEMVLVGRR